MEPERFMIPCLSKKILGIECMGWGTQRAFFMVVDGEFVAAFKMFPPIYTTILFFVFVGLHFVDKSRNYHKFMIGFGIINALIMIAAYIFKMTNT